MTPGEYVTVTSGTDGTAYASSYLNYVANSAAKAFGTSSSEYWISDYNPKTPIQLWFEFNEPKRVTKIKFEEKYGLRDGNEYEVFASDADGDCGNLKNQIVLANAEHGVFKSGKEFENKRSYLCYGIRTYHPGERLLVALYKVLFGFEGICDSSWRAGNHETSDPKTCKIYAEKKYCAGGTYGSGWLTFLWGKFEDYADDAGRTALICPECGCKDDDSNGIDDIEVTKKPNQILIPDKQCCSDEKCTEYRGVKATTTKGRPCQSWNSQTPHEHIYGKEEDSAKRRAYGLEENFCRNPTYSEKAWCYTTDPNKRWEFCDIPKC